MIELVREQLDPRDQERWRVALSRPALVSRPARRLDIEILIVALPLWSAPFVLTFHPWTEEPTLVAYVCRALSAAAWFLALRAAVRAHRRTSWPEGRFLYAWGYAEIERDVMRVIPIGALALGIYGGRLPFDPIRLTITEGPAKRTLRIAARELRGLEDLLEGRTEIAGDRSTLGYRDAPPSIEGPRGEWPLSPRLREVGWGGIAAVVGVVLPFALVPASSPRADRPTRIPSFHNDEGLRPEYASSLSWRDDVFHVGLDLGGCSSSSMVIGAIESYLELALRNRRLGPAHPDGLPGIERMQLPTRIQARCTWVVDTEQGTFAHADAAWSLRHRAEPLVRRHVSVDVHDVLGAMGRCDRSPRLDLSPRRLAASSGALLRALIARDVYQQPLDVLTEQGDLPEVAACMSDYAASLHVVAER